MPRDGRTVAEKVPSLDPTPTVSLLTLARACGPNRPVDLWGLIQRGGPRRRTVPYRTPRRRAVDLFVEGTIIDANEPGLSDPEREVIRAMERMQLRRPPWVSAVRPVTRSAPFVLNGVRVTGVPDVELDGHLASGAACFYLGKEPLARGVGSTMAALLWYWRKYVGQWPATSADHCLVYEPRLPWTHLPSRDPMDQIEEAKVAAHVITALWPYAVQRRGTHP